MCVCMKCVYVCMYVCMLYKTCACIYTYVYVCVCMFIKKSLQGNPKRSYKPPCNVVCMYTYAYIYIYIHTHTYIDMNVCVYV